MVWNLSLAHRLHVRNVTLWHHRPRRVVLHFDRDINPLWLGDAIWHLGSGSTLAQVILYRLAAPSPYHNKYWLLIGVDLGYSNENNFSRPLFYIMSVKIIIEELLPHFRGATCFIQRGYLVLYPYCKSFTKWKENEVVTTRAHKPNLWHIFVDSTIKMNTHWPEVNELMVP